jgi:hypothetical protein
MNKTAVFFALPAGMAFAGYWWRHVECGDCKAELQDRSAGANMKVVIE